MPFTLPTKNHFDLGLYYDLAKEIQGSYRLEVNYNDIYMNKYMQSVLLVINDKVHSIDFNQPQVQLKNTTMSHVKS